MNEQKARQEGLSFTGCYERDKESVKEEAKKIRKLGFKARVVTKYANPLSRGQNTGITGWSVYADKKYFASKALEENKKRKEAIPSRLEKAKEDYKAAVQKIKEDEAALEINIAKNNRDLLVGDE